MTCTADRNGKNCRGLTKKWAVSVLLIRYPTEFPHFIKVLSMWDEQRFFFSNRAYVL